MGDFFGFSTGSIKIGQLEMEFLETAGPRIVSLKFEGSENLFAEVPTLTTNTPYGDFRYLGGHRLWHAPEAMPRTYIPDNNGCTYRRIDNGVCLTGKIEEMSGIQKKVNIQIDPTTNSVSLVHTLVNHNAWEIKLAPWAITMFRHGGRVVIPTRGADPDTTSLLPDRNLILWSYAKINDPRLRLMDDRIELAAEMGDPFKVGTFNPLGWMSYTVNDIKFTKTFRVHHDSEQVDFGCNAECYCDEHFVELESLGPYATIMPGQKTNWEEKWELKKI